VKYWTTKSGIEIHKVLGGRCNCYLVSNGNRFLLIDTGRKRNWRNLESGLNRLGVKEGSSISLVLTHCHFDHAENAARFKKTYKASIIVHKSEGDCLKSGENPNIAGTVFLTKVLSGILSRTKLLARLGYEPADYDVLVDEKFGLEPFGFPGYVLHTPGHTGGSISAIIDDEIAIVGDAMFGVFAGSVFPPFADDVGLMVESWKKLLDTGCRIYLSAHGSERSEDLLNRQYDKYKSLYDR
jgi:glyoxylase-like metal-dependent hydrolase (beta-lactamase superfamily II)